MIDQVTGTADAAPDPGGAGTGAAAGNWKFVRAADGHISGVCKSVAVATGLDAGLVRLAMIGAALWGPGVLAYLAVVIATPRAETEDDPRVAPAPEETARILRVVLAIGGILGALSVVGGIGWADWPVGSFYRDGGGIGLTLVAVAIAVVVLRRRQSDDGSSSVRSPAAGLATSDVPGAAGGPGWPAPDAPSAPDAPADVPVTAASPSAAPAPVARGSAYAAPFPIDDAPVTDADDNRVALLVTRITGWLVVLGAVACAAGLVVAMGLGILELRLPGLVWPLAAAALVAACVALVRARSIAVVSATIVALVVAWSIGALATSWTGPAGTRTVVVADTGELLERYEQAAGWLTLDLASLDLEEDTVVAVDVGAGRVDIVVPDDLAVDLRSDVWAGESRLLGQETNGWRVSDRVRDTPTGAAGTLTIELDVGAGSARVCRASLADDDRHCPA